MKFDRATDAFIAGWRAYGRIRSPHTEASYRRVLRRPDRFAWTAVRLAVALESDKGGNDE